MPLLTGQLVDTILAGNPGYGSAAVVPTEDLTRSCHDNIVRVLQLMDTLETDQLDENAHYFDAARATGERRAQQGLPLDDVLRSFRFGGSIIWEAFNDEVGDDEQIGPDALRLVGTRLWSAVDKTSAQVAATYHSTEMRLVRADDQRRAAVWEGLLSGRSTDPRFLQEASRVIDLPLNGRFVVVVIDDANAGVCLEPADLVSRIQHGLLRRGIESAWQPRADTTVGILQLDEQSAQTALHVLAVDPLCSAGMSSVIHALADIEAAHRQALLALHSLARGVGAVSLDDRLPEALLLNSAELSADLVRLWLGPLLDLDAAARKPLWDTLQIWVDSGGSTARSAELLHCHRNTVINRIRHLEDILGQPLSTTPLPIEFNLAIRAHLLTCIPDYGTQMHNRMG